MENFLLYAIVVLAVAALGGLFMAHRILNGKLAPWFVSLVHLALGGAGLVLVFLAVSASTGANMVIGWLTFGILLITALGGFLLASMHLRQKIAPASIVILHATLGVAGVLLLLGLAFLFTSLTQFNRPGAGYSNLQLVLTMLT